MSDTKDGGPAFPRASKYVDFDGMSLRDWFAGQALRLIADALKTQPDLVARACYKFADAMLAEREKEDCRRP